MEFIIRYTRKLICLPIWLYQWFLSPMFIPSCRYYPSCSNYALDAILHYGVLKGLFFAGRRLLRCHPWNDGGYDPLLPSQEKKL